MLVQFEIPEQAGHDWGRARFLQVVSPLSWQYAVMADQEDQRDTLLPVTFLHSYNISVIME